MLTPAGVSPPHNISTPSRGISAQRRSRWGSAGIVCLALFLTAPAFVPGCKSGGAINEPGTPANQFANVTLELAAIGLLITSDNPAAQTDGFNQLAALEARLLGYVVNNPQLSADITKLVNEFARTGEWDQAEWGYALLALSKWVNTPPDSSSTPPAP